MLRALNCTFCGRSIPSGTGVMYVKRDGNILYFCSSKCRKSMLYLRRNPAKSKWTKSTRRTYK
ncbi:MAG: 50S ribosomal protein L24e [Candidatus Nezhaarchaeota archaeon]|nr:50S ribosomal protein L24e [Candidatus Nezhaarchaeota archaeon]